MHADLPDRAALPESLRPLFWDVSFEALSWRQHYDFIVRRILQEGRWEDIVWLRRQIGDAGLRDWLVKQRGGRLEPRRLHFWQLILRLPARSVARWVERFQNEHWSGRRSP